MKRLLAVTLLGLGLSFGASGPACAAPISAPGDLSQAIARADGSAVTQTRGWWAVPLVVGGVILYHHHRHYRGHHYKRCYWHHGHRHCYRRDWY